MAKWINRILALAVAVAYFWIRAVLDSLSELHASPPWAWRCDVVLVLGLLSVWLGPWFVVNYGPTRRGILLDPSGFVPVAIGWIIMLVSLFWMIGLKTLFWS